ncbi:MAG: BON domain-containing protein [Parvularculaceae bacterium]
MRRDEEIRDDILAEIDWDPKIDSTDIGVTVKNGAVALMGTVSSYAEKLAAEEAAKRVKGVRAIAEEIKVRLPSDLRLDDEAIASRISNILQWHSSIANFTIQAEVRNGFVSLTGEVDRNYQRDLAKMLVSGVSGVTAVSNLIKVKSKVLPTNVQREITRALHRNADIEASHVKVDVDGGRVTLKGNVKAWYERKLIEDAAWAAPGVTDVVDVIRIA